MNEPADKARRKFLTGIAGATFGVGVVGVGLGMFAKQSQALPAQAIRPPGALPEDDFLGACIRCGLCVRDCPYDILHLSELGDPIPLGTPYFVAREIPCEMCEDIPCVAACPTGALDHALTNIDDARMGLAVLIDQETCLNFLGLRCEVCYRVCPLIDEAITLERQHNVRTGMHARYLPTVHSDTCTGCGKCEHACVLEEAAIKVLPEKVAKGRLGRHYRPGWQEKSRAGKSLVTPDVEHQYNLPEGMRYEHAGRGLIMDDSDTNPAPFGDDALDTLKKLQRATKPGEGQ
ncbi:MAG: ferredoxin-type protein NapG [Pseudomonadota bacterium]